MSVDPRRARMQARTNPTVSEPAAAAAAAATGAAIAPPLQNTVPNVPPPQPIEPQLQSAAGTSVSTPNDGNEKVSEQAVAPPPIPITSTNGPEVSQPTPQDSFKLKFCTVCASNNNRSMEAHLRLSTSDKNYPVISFGTGSYVRLPGPTISQPQVYNFNTTSYAQMHDELEKQDARLYKNNGILNMLTRNKNIKWGPERFHDWVVGKARVEPVNRGDKGAHGAESGVVDVIFTCEERCWDAVVDNLLDRGAPLNRPVHVFNVDIRDNHEEALVGGRAILELANDLNEAASKAMSVHGINGWQNGAGAARLDFDESVPDILAAWQDRWPHLPALWTLSWL